MNVKARVSFEPAADLWMLVCRIVVCNQMELFSRRCGIVYESEELDPFLVTMTLLAEADHFAAGRVECGKQSRGAMPFVIVGHCARPARLHRQTGL